MSDFSSYSILISGRASPSSGKFMIENQWAIYDYMVKWIQLVLAKEI